MKKLLLIALGVFFSGTIVWALVSVDSIGVKNNYVSGEVAGNNMVTYVEFNKVVDTIKGIFNNKDRNNIGINTEPSEFAKLKVDKFIKVVPISQANRPSCSSGIEGAIYAESGNENHLWGCNGTDWVQLDTEDPACS